jgi:hypothetical protein
MVTVWSGALPMVGGGIEAETVARLPAVMAPLLAVAL